VNPFQPMYLSLTRTPRLEVARKGIRGPMTEPVLLEGGYYDVARRDDLKRELHGVEPHSDVVLDLAHTESLDCSCLGILVAKLGAWRERKPDTNLRLQNVTQSLERALRLLKLDNVFIIESVRPNRAGPGAHDGSETTAGLGVTDGGTR
jgi:anti-anti-sigma regulatory factor